VSRQVRKVQARQERRRQAHQAVHPAPLAPLVQAAALQPAPTQPLADTLLAWLEAFLAGRGHNRPTRKRFALLVAGLLRAEQGTPSGIARAAFGLAIGTAQQEASVARRVARLLADPHLDPARLLPDLAAALLPHLLAPVCRAHDHSIGSHAGHVDHHARWIGVRLLVDETTLADHTHVLVVGLAYRGIVLPLGLRTWAQNTPLAAGAYWTALAGLLWEVHAVLPPVLRDHVLVLADRGYGVPTMLDLLASLGWHWVIRVAGQTRLRLPDGTECSLRTLVPAPGTCWHAYTPAVPPTPPPAAGPPVLAVFKKARWRMVHVVAMWAAEQADPWLLVTTLPSTPARQQDYAARWAIERLFLAWKSHGWNVETTGLRAPAAVARLLTGYVVATWWLVAAALPIATAHLDALALHTGRPLAHPIQLRLPWGLPSRPAPAKRSLFTYGRDCLRELAGRHATPRLCWSFPDWHAPVWSVQCQQVYDGLAP
jgi:DDE family transposase